MRTYFCPSCGQSYESKDCRRTGGALAIWALECPTCQCSLQLSGAAFIVAGLLTCLFLGLILCEEAQVLGIILGAAFVAVGIIRLVRRWRASSSG